MNALAVMVSAFLGLALLYAASSKSLAISLFASQIASFRIPLLPASLTLHAARLVVLTEALLGFGLLLFPYSVAVACAATVLFMVLLTLVLFIWIQKRNVSCFCFGESDGAISATTVIRNVALSVLSSVYCILCVLYGEGFSPLEFADRMLLTIYGLTAMLTFLSAFSLVSVHHEMGTAVG